MQTKTAGRVVAMGIAVFAIAGSSWALSVVASSEGGNWADAAAWKTGAPPGAEDTAFVRDGSVLTIDSDVKDIGLLYLGDSGAIGTLDILEGGELILNKSSFVGRQKSGSDGILNISGGSLQMGDKSGSMTLMIGVDTAADSVTGCFTISGGKFAGRILLGSSIPEDAGEDILRIIGSEAEIGTKSTFGKYSLEVRESGTIEYIFDEDGVSGMVCPEIATFRPGSKIIVDGAAYKGGRKTFKLLKAAVISPKSPEITLKNFAEGTKFKWDASKDVFTVTTP